MAPVQEPQPQRGLLETVGHHAATGFYVVASAVMVSGMSSVSGGPPAIREIRLLIDCFGLHRCTSFAWRSASGARRWLPAHPHPVEPHDTSPKPQVLLSGVTPNKGKHTGNTKAPPQTEDIHDQVDVAA